MKPLESLEFAIGIEGDFGIGMQKLVLSPQDSHATSFDSLILPDPLMLYTIIPNLAPSRCPRFLVASHVQQN